MRSSRGSAGKKREAQPVDPSDLGAATDVALQILNAAAQSRAALIRRLQRRGFDAETSAEAAQRMADYGYVDDAALATSIANRRRSSGYGAARIALDLRGRGIPKEDLASVLDGIRDDGNDVALAMAAARRFGSVSDADPALRDKQRRRAASFLQRRGFSGETVAAVLRSLGNDVAPDD